MKSSHSPDVNVRLAPTHSRHVHGIAALWLESAGGSSLFFCRFTQYGLEGGDPSMGFPRLAGLEVELLSGRV